MLAPIESAMKYESQHTLFYQFHYWLIFQKLQKQGQCAGQTIPDGEHPRLRCAWEYNGPLRRPPHTRSTHLGLFSFRGKKKKNIQLYPFSHNYM